MNLTEYRVYLFIWTFFFCIFAFFSVECGRAGNHFWEGGCAILSTFCGVFGLYRAFHPPTP